MSSAMPAPGALTRATRPDRQARMSPGTPEERLGHEDLGIEVEVVDPPVDHVHPLQAVDGAGVDAVVVQHHQVAALDQLHPQLLGQEGVLEVGRVVDARCQHHDGRVTRGGGHGGQHVGQPADVGVDRLDAVVPEHLGEDVLGHHPVLQEVGHARRHPQIVLQHVDGPIGVADEVAPADVGPDPTGRVHPHALPSEVGRAGHQLGGDHPGAHRPLVVVDVVDEQVEGVQPLDQSRLDRVPLIGGHHPGDDVEGPGAVDARRPLVDREGHPDGPHLAVGGLLALGQGLGTELGEVAPQGLGLRTGLADLRHHLVIELTGVVRRPAGSGTAFPRWVSGTNSATDLHFSLGLARSRPALSGRGGRVVIFHTQVIRRPWVRRVAGVFRLRECLGRICS